MRRKMIYFCPESQGGLADYARAQANAIAREGVEVVFLTRRCFTPKAGDLFRVVDALKEEPEEISSFRWVRRYQRLQVLMKNLAILRGLILSLHVKEVVWSSFFEYGAPFWIGYFQGLRDHGVRMGVIVHDPIRDYQVGPAWWHRKSIREAASLFDCFFYHSEIVIDVERGGESEDDFSVPMAKEKQWRIPHGLYRFPEPRQSREVIRDRMRTPMEARVWLVFGQLRDGKNLDLVLEGLSSVPSDFLWVIGVEQSIEQRSFSDYQKMAESLGVDARVRWLHQYLPEEEVGDYFQAADVVVLTYSRDFHSSSGVLSLAVHYQRPVLASGGEGRLTEEVKEYRLGEVIEADSREDLKRAMEEWGQESRKGLSQGGEAPEWERYVGEHSWESNARIVLTALK